MDNGSSDDTYDYVKSRYGGRVRVVKLGKDYGYCLGNNFALRYVSKDAKYILFQNPDAILTRDYVKNLVEIMGHDRELLLFKVLRYSHSEGVVRLEYF